MAMRKRDDEVFPNAAGIDVGASSHWVAVPKHLAEQAGCEPVREVGAMTDDLNGLADWRLCGRLSRMIRAGLVTGSGGESLLTPPGSRLSFKKLFVFGLWDATSEDELANRVAEALRKLAYQAGVSLVTLSVAWVLASKAVTAPIIGASRPEQLGASLAAATFTLDPVLKQQLDELTHEYRMGDAAR